jgi:hypothetical protein
MDQRKRLAELLSRTDYWTNERVFNEAEKIYKNMVAKKMQNKKRDRTGEKYGEFTIIRPGEIDKEWVARCACGKERLVKNQNMSKLTHCKSCAAKLRMQKRTKKPKKPKKDKFTERQNWMAPKRPKFKLDVLYELNYSQCNFPCVGKLINEYGKSASFEVVEYHDSDKAVLRMLGYRISVKKKAALELCRV